MEFDFSNPMPDLNLTVYPGWDFGDAQPLAASQVVQTATICGSSTNTSSIGGAVDREDPDCCN